MSFVSGRAIVYANEVVISGSETNLTSISEMSISRCVRPPDERWRHFHAHTKGLLRGDSSVVLHPSISAEERLRFNHVEYALTHEDVCLIGRQMKGSKQYPVGLLVDWKKKRGLLICIQSPTSIWSVLAQLYYLVKFRNFHNLWTAFKNEKLTLSGESLLDLNEWPRRWAVSQYAPSCQSAQWRWAPQWSR